MEEFYTITLDKREKVIRDVWYVIVTIVFAAVVTIASGIF